jgi:hypothetical protein
MNKKQIISVIIPLVVLLLIIGGLAIFRQLHQEKPDQLYDFSDSTSWSQDKDFILQADKEGLTIQNAKIPFSCQLLPDWQAEVTKIEDQGWAIDIYHPETTFTSDKLIQSGCWLNLKTIQSGEYNQFLKEEIQELTKSNNSPSSLPATLPSYQIEHRILATQDNYQALEEITFANQIQLITIDLPLDKGQIIEIEGQFHTANLEDCQQGLDAIFKTMKISKD